MSENKKLILFYVSFFLMIGIIILVSKLSKNNNKSSRIIQI